ncbi:MAG: methyltransferase domain-containing protein [Bacteroidia bacterium]|nr:methyltransferase domain-containing protein [Bacteroidia bacterium]
MSLIKKENDPIGQAIWDYANGIREDSIVVNSEIAEDDVLLPSYFFREYDQMPIQEQKALSLCNGRILDVGAGAGAHVLWLQEKGYDVDALEISKLSCDTMTKRGVKNVILQDIWEYKDQKYDTILMLMNGAGLARTLPGLSTLLNHLKTLLNPKGKILIDSSDLLYLFEDKTIVGLPFTWLFVDQETLRDCAQSIGFKVCETSKGDHYDFLLELALA